VVWRKGARSGIEVKHNRRYGADCVQRLGPTEIAAEIAAPHQNEGPHLAAGFRAGPSADRSGARGKHDMPGRQRPMRKYGQQDPERHAFAAGPLPFPLPRFSAGTGSLSRLPYGAESAVLTGTPSPQKQTPSWDGGMGALWIGRPSLCHKPAGLPLVGTEISEVDCNYSKFLLTDTAFS
jgi:hypothetical protein